MLTKKEKEKIETMLKIFEGMYDYMDCGKMFLTKVKSN